MSGPGERPDAPGPDRSGGADAGGGSPDGGVPRQPPATLLVGTLGLLAMAAGLAIVLVHQWASPRIEAHRARELRVAIQEVLGGPARYETRWLADGELMDSLPAGRDTASATPVYAGFDSGGGLIGYAMAGEKPGYQDVVRLIFGYDPEGEVVVGMKVLESKETPGLGSKIISDSSFVGEFAGVETPLVPVKDPEGAPGEVDIITGATISSETVVEIINERLELLTPALRPASRAGAAHDEERTGILSGSDLPGEVRGRGPATARVPPRGGGRP